MEFKDNVRLLLEISKKTSDKPFERSKMSSGEYNVIASYISELDRLLFQFYETDSEILKKKYLSKIINTYADTKKHMDEFIVNNDQ